MSAKTQVESHYDAVATEWAERYSAGNLMTLKDYPAEYFRLQMLLNSFVGKGVKRVLEVGVGGGTPLATIAGTGVDVWGFDISDQMVKKSRERMKKSGLDPTHIFKGDIQDPTSYLHCLKEGRFDGLLAMGVMPHVENDENTLVNMKTCVREGGTVFIEFRNKLFSLFTFNRNTLEFILDDLLVDVNDDWKKRVRKDLEKRLRVDMPPVRGLVKGKKAPGYDAILSKFHNPFEVRELFEKTGFKDIKFLWYHYHPAFPFLESADAKGFRKEAMRLEGENSGWRGMFLCSAFVVEAVVA